MLIKFLGVVFLLGLVWFLLRRSDRGAHPPAAKSSTASTKKLEIVACHHCGVHLPRQELLLGPGGNLFCCEAHRRLAQEAHR